MPTSATVACPHCAAENTSDSHFCQSCGLALPETDPSGPRIIGDADFASNPAGVAFQQDELAKQMKKATNALLIVAVIQTGFGFLLYFLVQRSIQQGKVMVRSFSARSSASLHCSGSYIFGPNKVHFPPPSSDLSFTQHFGSQTLR